MHDYSSLLSKVASNDPSLVELDISFRTPGIPENRGELVQRVVDALATNTHVKSLKLKFLLLSEDDIAPLAELLKTRDFESLDLGRNELTGSILMPALAARNSTRVLGLCDNKCLTVLAHLDSLTNLQELDLSLSELFGVPSGVLELPNLEVLKLGYNSLRALPAQFTSLVSLKRLHIENCGWPEFPALLLRLTRLEELDISVNWRITSIPDGITALGNLNRFSVSRCGLAKFPTAITRLAHLESLDLSENQIKVLPGEIGNLRRLKEVSLAGCGLTKLPRALWTLANLEQLTLNSNPLATLPGGVGALQRLKVLEVFGCQLEALPSTLQSLTQLDRLEISNTKMTHLPIWLGSLRSLRNFRLSAHLLFGVAVKESTYVTFEELAAPLCNSSDPEVVQKLSESFKELLEKDPLRLMRIAQMHYGPRTQLRALCVDKFAASHLRLDLERLPAHLRDEISRVSGEEEEQPSHRGCVCS